MPSTDYCISSIRHWLFHSAGTRGDYSRAASIPMNNSLALRPDLLLEGGDYSRAASDRGNTASVHANKVGPSGAERVILRDSMAQIGNTSSKTLT